MHTTTISITKSAIVAIYSLIPIQTGLGLRLVINNRVPRKLWVYSGAYELLVYSTPAMQQTMLHGTVIKIGTCAHRYRKWISEIKGHCYSP